MTDWVTISAEDYRKLIAYVNLEERGELVRVVRCKDCKYCKVECGNYCCYVDDYLKMPTPHYGDFYCADGERREVQDDD